MHAAKLQAVKEKRLFGRPWSFWFKRGLSRLKYMQNKKWWLINKTDLLPSNESITSRKVQLQKPAIWACVGMISISALKTKIWPKS